MFFAEKPMKMNRFKNASLLLSFGLFCILTLIAIRTWSLSHKPDIRPVAVDLGTDCSGSHLIGELFVPRKAIRAAVILIAGSGSSNGVYYGKSLFVPIVSALIDNNIETIIIDKNINKKYYSYTIQDHSKDIQKAYDYIMRTCPTKTKIFLIGHSEGAVMCIVASLSLKVDGIVLLASPFVSGNVFFKSQFLSMAKSEGYNDAEVSKGGLVLDQVIAAAKGGADHESILRIYQKNGIAITASVMESSFRFGSPWGRSFIDINPRSLVGNYKGDILLIFGAKDCQVPAVPNAQMDGLNPRMSVLVVPDINHLMRACDTGSVEEYQSLEGETDIEVIGLIKKWILTRL